MKCTRCRGEAVVRLPSHNAKFCAECFDLFFLSSVRRGLKKLDPPPHRPIAVAVSGGKDSLAAWDVLHRLGYETVGLHLDLGVEGFSEASAATVAAFARPRGLDWRVYELEALFGYRLPDLDRRTRLDTCAVCGALKRGWLNRLAVEEGFTVLATGHHLDDEAGRLLGNLVRHRRQYLAKFYPYLPSTHPKLAARIKPLYRVDETEIKTYVALRGIEPVQGPGCPFQKGATSHYFKAALEFLEEKMPGTKRDFLFTYLKRQKPPLEAEEGFMTCAVCGQPTYGELCAVCRLKERLSAQEARWAVERS